MDIGRSCVPSSEHLLEGKYDYGYGTRSSVLALDRCSIRNLLFRSPVIYGLTVQANRAFLDASSDGTHMRSRSLYVLQTDESASSHRTVSAYELSGIS